MQQGRQVGGADFVSAAAVVLEDQEPILVLFVETAVPNEVKDMVVASQCALADGGRGLSSIILGLFAHRQSTP